MIKMQFVLLTALLATPALAQTKPASNPLSLGTLLRQAQESARVADDQFKEATRPNSGKPFDACKTEFLDFTASYHQWFVDHFAEYQRRDHELSSAYSLIAGKIESLKSVQMLQVESQNEKKEISLRVVTEFLSQLNQRLATAPADQLDLVIAQMERPRYNSTGATFAQIKEAVKIMTSNLNAQLKENAATYRLEFTQRERSYDLEFVMSVNGLQEYRFSLISGAGATTLSDEMRLQLIASSKEKIDGYSADAAQRYFEMYDKLMSLQCQELALLTYDCTQEKFPVSPWLNPNQLLSKVDRNLDRVPSHEALIKKYNITFEGTNPESNVFSNGRKMSCAKDRSLFLENKGTLQIFEVNRDQTLYFHDGRDWTKVPGYEHIDTQTKMVRAFALDGVAMAVLQTPQGYIIIDSTGKTVKR